MNKTQYATIGFISVGILAFASIFFGGQMHRIVGLELFFPIMSTVATFLVFAVPEGPWMEIQVSIFFSTIFSLHFIVLSGFVAQIIEGIHLADPA